MTPLWWARFLFIKEHGTEEMLKEIEQGRGCECDLEEMYKKVIMRQRAKQILRNKKRGDDEEQGDPKIDTV
jgi:hypothetical protein